MFLVFQISQNWVGTPIADLLVGWLEGFQSWVGDLLSNASPLLSAIVVDGVIGGISGALGGAGKGSKHLTNLGKQTVKRRSVHNNQGIVYPGIVLKPLIVLFPKEKPG